MAKNPTHEKLTTNHKYSHKSESLLRETEKKYRSIVENQTEMICRFTPDCTLTYVNESYARNWGKAPEEMIGINFLTLIPEHNKEFIKKHFNGFSSKKNVRLNEHPVIRKNGEIGWQQWCNRAFFDDDYNVIEFQSVGRDITELKQSELALRESQGKLSAILASMADHASMMDSDLNISWANETAKELFGENLVGKKCYQAYHGRKTPCEPYPCIVLKTFEDGQSHKHETQVIDKNGQTRYFHCTSNVALRDGNRNPTAVMEISRDITEQKKDEEAIQKSEEKYRSFVQNFQGIAYKGDLKTWTPIFFQGAVEAITGYSENELVKGNPRWDQVIHPDDAKNLPGKNEIPTVPNYIVERDYRIIRKDGDIRWVNELMRNICDESGKPCSLEGTIIEITQRKQAEEQLKQSEKRYRSMMESITDPLYICSSDLKVEYMNPAMIDRVGRNALGEICYKALHNLDLKCEWCVFEKIKEGGPIETTILSPKDKRHYRVTNMPIDNQDGSFSKMTILRDITDYLNAVSESEKAKALMLQSQKLEAIGHLAGGIAHDFNNILSAILGYTELALIEAEKGRSVKESLQSVHKAGKRARDLVKQILTFARKSEEKLIPVRIDMILKELMLLMRSTIPTSIEIRKNIKSRSMIIGNPTQIHQIFMNLCANAAQAMEDTGGVLAVNLRDAEIDHYSFQGQSGLTTGKYVVASISDTGPGIKPEIIESIFEPYFTTKEAGKGTGLGLSLVHGIVEAYGGKIFVNSELGKGATFDIYLPLAETLKTQTHYKKAELPSGTERILFVDDELPIAELGENMLLSLGYHATSCSSSLKALDLFRSKPDDFDLVITDMTMPDMNGDQLALEILKIRPEIPIILCTGYSSKISDKTAEDIGIKAFAYKPFSMSDLAKTVRKVLDKAKSEN